MRNAITNDSQIFYGSEGYQGVFVMIDITYNIYREYIYCKESRLIDSLRGDTRQVIMRISAQVKNQEGSHEILLQTQDRSHTITIPPKKVGMGSSANGGELLFLALATCYCNDIYREAAKRGIMVDQVEVKVWGEFPEEGMAARNVRYSARITAQASDEEVRDLMRHTDRVAEIHNTLRAATPVELETIEAINSQRTD